jgi:hypothetical protein
MPATQPKKMRSSLGACGDSGIVTRPEVGFPGTWLGVMPLSDSPQSIVLYVDGAILLVFSLM